MVASQHHRGTVDFMGPYQRRIIDDELDELFPQLPAVLLDGPKGVGKTSTAEQRCVRVRRLDVEAERQVVAANPAVISGDDRPLLLDEWQRVHATWDAVRRLVDEDPSGGQFILTGSAPTKESHSGAGRITSMRMRPLTLPERGVCEPSVSLAALLGGDVDVGGRTDVALADYVAEMVAGGFPGLRHLEGRALTRQLDSYLERIASHDLPEAGFALRRPVTVMAWLHAYAAATGTTASWEKIRTHAQVSADAHPAKTTTQPYIELLTALRILDPVPAWIPSNNHLGVLTQAPCHHLADPALAARLVKRSATRLLRGEGPSPVQPRDGGFLGGLFESLATLSVRVFAQASDARVHHLRTEKGRREVDLIVETDDGVIGIEVKLAAAVDDADVRHLIWLRDKLGDECIDTVVLHTGPEAYRRTDNVAVVPLALLGP